MCRHKEHSGYLSDKKTENVEEEMNVETKDALLETKQTRISIESVTD